MPRIAIIILNWNRPRLSIKTINSILNIRHRHFDYQIFLTDNGSSDNSLKRFHRTYHKNKKIKIISTGSNLGFVGGNNFAIKLALRQKYDYLLICNNDVLVDPLFLEKLLLPFKKDRRLAVVGPKIYFAPGFEFHSSRYSKKQLGQVIWSAGGQMDWDNILGGNIGVDQVDRGQFDQPQTDIDFLSGCCFLVKSSVVKKIGLFNPAYFMYLEDVDFCQRAKQAGYKILYQPPAKIWHLNSGSSASGSHLQDYFIIRNRLYFAKRYANPRARFALFRQAVKILFSSNRWKRQAVIDYYLKRLGRGSWK